MNRLWSPLSSPFSFGVLLLVFSVAFPPLDDIATISLPIHMLQHVMISLSGFAIGYSLSKSGRVPNLLKAVRPFGSFIAVAALLILWHLPIAWDLAVSNPIAHAFEHASFLFVGLMASAVLLPSLSSNDKIGLSLLGFFAQLAYALLLVSSYDVYPLYTLQAQSSLGLAMLLTGPFYSTGILFLLAKYRGWFQDEPPGQRNMAPRWSKQNRSPAILNASFCVAIIFTLVAYYGMAAASLSASSSVDDSLDLRPSAAGAIVYIVENPAYWQYSPQTIKVVIGINNTVTWVSKSFSYDTVTSQGGGPQQQSFNSGPISPGKSFTFTFTAPGEYEYDCIYHVWMKGLVIVSD